MVHMQILTGPQETHDRYNIMQLLRCLRHASEEKLYSCTDAGIAVGGSFFALDRQHDVIPI